MGVKELWGLLNPYSQRLPLCELQGKIVAIDLAGWICESLNVVDYFVHPRHYLKNLFFRTCYLLLNEITPVFVLDGKAPELKYQVISKRNELQFRGVKPRGNKEDGKNAKNKGRTRFNHVLKQCEILLECMGLRCLQATGEAEAFCAFLNEKGLVDGIISQDSDCFAYGAVRVYRNFSVSSQGNAAAQGGAVDVYDIRNIRSAIDFGQDKIIVLALLCGCDYCPDGVGGIGKDSVLKLFAKYKNCEILDRIRSWRKNDDFYTTLELKVDDKNICTSCGHSGRLQNHNKNGCSLCKFPKGCDENLWRDQRNSIKAELMLRKKALADQNFPSEEIIDEFKSCPKQVPDLDLKWNQPNLVKFVKVIGNLLQWTEIYSFQKLFPLLTRWLLFHHENNIPKTALHFGTICPDFIRKKRNPKGIPSYEIVWKSDNKSFAGLIPDDQIQAFITENPKGIEELWTSIEPISLVENAFPQLVENYIDLTQKSKKKPTKKKKIVTNIEDNKNDSLRDMSGLLEAAKEIEKDLKPKKRKPKAGTKPAKGIQMITKFLKETGTPSKILDSVSPNNCSTPKRSLTLDLEKIGNSDDSYFDFSFIIRDIVSKPMQLLEFKGKKLKYQSIHYDSNLSINRSKDDLDLLPKRKKISQDDMKNNLSRLSFNFKSLEDIDTGRVENFHDVPSDLVNISSGLNKYEIATSFNSDHRLEHSAINVSHFFTNDIDGIDEFERTLDMKNFIDLTESDED